MTGRMHTALLDLVFPRVCAGCGAAVEDGAGHLCWDCLADMQVVTSPFCEVCGDPAEGRVGHAYTCAACVRRRPAFDRARSAVRYAGGIRAALQAFKYSAATCLDRDLLPLLLACVRAHFPQVRFDGVVSVPLYPRKERERHYNQSELLARRLARALRLPLAAGALRRVRDTGSQTALSAAQRRHNVARAFQARRPEWIEGRYLLLVDDVMTTGATVGECSRVLRDAGAAGVYVVTVARG